ncbi:AMP-binding protein [Methylomarinum vadi]|uniref:AMP-binding protein n=1 Tax=Methylomarinum vadi TaxID=438855 RepID=UPI0004DF4135|nr:AMP-binding protein [Methylomarinum vadi]
MCAEWVSLTEVGLLRDDERTVAVHDGRTISQREFCAEVSALSSALRQQPQPQQRYALYYENSYPFAVALFALLHTGKQIWIPGNNRPAMAEQLKALDCRLLGDWAQSNEGRISVASSIDNGFSLQPLDLHRPQLTIFTSGSGGEPKAITKSLLQLQNEVETLERQWGKLLGSASALATVSHQHIYGLLFRLLWPLAAGRTFHSQMYLSPEPMLKAAILPAYWVASPAQLKRLDDLTAWNQLASLTAIFSSGGPLPVAAAECIERESGQPVIEIYGSSETGGIGWRSLPIVRRWMPFPGIELGLDDQGRCRLASPYLPEPGSCLLDDRLELNDDGRFELAGRVDRIVKVEEKRLSLDQLERTLQRSQWVEQAYCQLVEGSRDRIAALIVSTESGMALLQQEGRSALIRRLRRHLMQDFETVVLPRKWLFMDAMPQTAQGKVDTALLAQLWRLEPSKFPQLLSCRHSAHQVVLELRVRPGLVYFDGHFPGQPILPGVAQLAWVERYGKIFFAIDRPFLTMEVIKFKKIIQPGAHLTLTLEWKRESGKLHFEVVSALDSHSSGRMVYGERS